MRRIKKTFLHAGFILKVRAKVKDPESGKLVDGWEDIKKFFPTAAAANRYADKTKPGIKRHVEGVRVESTTLEPPARKGSGDGE